MKITIAMDSFKGSVSSLQAGSAVKTGIRRVFPEAEINVFPLADGGEGTADALIYGMNGKKQHVPITGPLGEPVTGTYGIVSQTETAVMEISEAAGITLVPKNKRNPLITTTYGIGEMIKDAITKGCRNFIIGIGGSATNDGGIGMLQALGYEVLDKYGNQVKRGAQGLKDIVDILDRHVIPELSNCHFQIACDVTNPLCGTNGCSAVFSPQKGATEEMIVNMDKWLYSYAKIALKRYPRADMTQKGTGAAGGLGFAFLTFMNAVLCSGVDIVLRETHFEEYVKDSDMIITGEGKLDGQTVMGKAPIGVAKLAKKYQKPVIAFAGCIEKEACLCNDYGIDAYFPIIRKMLSVENLMDANATMDNLADTAEQVFRLINCKFKQNI